MTSPPHGPSDPQAASRAPMQVPARHFVLGTPMAGPLPAGARVAVFGMGCFWGAERLFWAIPGVHCTAVGYAGGATVHPTYREVCGGRTGHAEVVRVVFDPAEVSYGRLLQVFWEGHDPTQGMRQGNDVGTQYRSLILCADDEDTRQAQISRDTYARELAAAGLGPITTEVLQGGTFYFAEADHQQYLAKHPDGYCGLGGTGVTCPVGRGGPAQG